MTILPECTAIGPSNWSSRGGLGIDDGNFDRIGGHSLKDSLKGKALFFVWSGWGSDPAILVLPGL